MFCISKCGFEGQESSEELKNNHCVLSNLMQMARWMLTHVRLWLFLLDLAVENIVGSSFCALAIISSFKILVDSIFVMKINFQIGVSDGATQNKGIGNLERAHEKSSVAEIQWEVKDSCVDDQVCRHKYPSHAPDPMGDLDSMEVVGPSIFSEKFSNSTSTMDIDVDDIYFDDPDSDDEAENY
ncbi:Uncharacterized protein Fot_13867 [Forsythia ovata]|uniref:Uncharacterized protein n=1 Tax=Forsythia ovata TaxID=205694 RepID=A0ABD1W4Q1_9LAMI